jgi:hypothetical protein
MVFQVSRRSAAVLLSLLVPIVARAQDSCTALLQHGIYDSHISKTSTQSFQSFRSNFCSWYSSYRESHNSTGVGVSIPIADIPVGIQGNMTYGDADNIQKGLCSSQASASSDQGFWLDVSNTIDPNGAAAFRDCVKALRGGLDIQARINDDETRASISIAYLAPYGAGPGTLNSLSYPGWNCPTPPVGTDMRSIVSKTGQLTNAQVALVCERDVKASPFVKGGLQIVADDAQITVATSVGNYTQFFRPKIYQDPLADTAKVLASYPKGTILPFAGPAATIPAGWHPCDGHDGTVNLTDRVPFGAEKDAQLGQATEGSLSHHHSFAGRTQRPDGVDNVHVVQNGSAPLTVKGTDHTHAFGGATSEESSLPPVTRVYFIQKIS